MNVIGESVKHPKWGIGRVIRADERHIWVFFDELQEEKVILFPDYVGEFIEFENKVLQKEAIKEKNEKQRKTEDERKTKDEDLLKNVSKQCEKKGGKKIPPRKNIAFKLNYCDGGASAVAVGFRGVCTDQIIQYNIYEAKRYWCSDPDCSCRQYLDGKCTRSELDAICEDGGFTCYESISLRDWIAHAGTNLYGINKGRPRRMPNAQNGSLAVLTTRYPDSCDESDRVIIGAFIIDRIFEGDEEDSGTVSCNSGFHVEMRPNEVKKLKFWDYYHNADNSKQWGTGLYRYFEDEDALRLLEDIVKIKKGTRDQKDSENLLNRFKELH